MPSDPMALLVGFSLDQQVSVQKAFSGPLVLRERLGALDAETLATVDLEPVFREKPALHRYPGAMAKRVYDLAVHVRDEYGGDAARVWSDAKDSATLRANLAALPGFGEMKVKSLGAVLANRYGGKPPAGPPARPGLARTTPGRPASTGVFLAALCAFVAIGAALPVLPAYVRGPLRSSDLAVGIVVGAFAVTSVVCRPLAGRVADRRGRRVVLVTGALAMAIGGALYLVSHSVLTLVLARLVLGAGEGAVYTAGATWAVDL